MKMKRRHNQVRMQAKLCNHPKLTQPLHMLEDNDQLDDFACPDCGEFFSIWFFTRGRHAFAGYNYATLPS